MFVLNYTIYIRSCAPNLTVQAVSCKEEHGYTLYGICFFAMKDIPALEELSYDYVSSKQKIL
jgi:SET domain-containing protein